MRLKGRAWKFGDDISTDHITPGRYYHLRSNISELAKHIMEDADPDFMRKFKPGDFIVAGKNFGMGSSREHAPLALKTAGVSVVIAKSFARIFYRNAINIGLPLLIAPTDEIENGEEMEIDLSKGIIYTKRGEIRAKSLPEIMIKILNEGGLVNYIKKHGDLEI
ncbi:MAG: 3-isopropylmalate dehydratase small subunit [Archaeoglobaceae archaeon]|nr:3-isopropylmalate dehydratase small subunit [Archaeoglobaceae archaeon]MDW8128624.1 3-isopropylmalate dehydratase small subunit [Archaeoglobaceae archaeon]